MFLNNFLRKYQVIVDRCTREEIYGWGINWKNPTQNIDLVIKINEQTVKTIRADLARTDLIANRKFKSGNLGFLYLFPKPLSVNQDIKLEILIAETGEPVYKKVFKPVQNVLVMGKAKTGTTVISKTIQKSLPGEVEYHLEPQKTEFFASAKLLQRDCSHVIKIIYEHWEQRPNLRNAIVCGETGVVFEKVVFIVRDLRDELISRLLYWARPHSRNSILKDQQIEQWITLLKAKEIKPKDISLLDLFQEFGKIFQVNHESMINNMIHLSASYQDFIGKITRPYVLVRYEDFLSGKTKGLEEYLGLELSEDRGVGKFEYTRRSSSFNNWKQFYTQADIEYLRPRMEPVLEQQGYTDWELQPVDSLDEDLFSNYVQRIIADKNIIEYGDRSMQNFT